MLVGAFGAAAHLTMDHATLSNAADAGICVTQNLDLAFTDTLQFTHSTISGSGGTQGGEAMGGFVTMTVDFGTAADHGGNSFTGNAT